MHIWTQPRKGVAGDPRGVTMTPSADASPAADARGNGAAYLHSVGESNHNPRLPSADVKAK